MKQGTSPLDAGGTPAGTKSTTQAPAKATWKSEWKKTLAEGRKEEGIVIYSTAGSDARMTLNKNFKDKYGLEIEWVMGRGAELAQKLYTERRAGLYLSDMWLVGGSIPVAELKPQGVLDPIRIREPNILYFISESEEFLVMSQTSCKNRYGVRYLQEK